MIPVLKEKSYLFAVAVVKVVHNLQEKKREFVLSNQFLRSGTAIGALIYEAEFAESKADYIHKLVIALKEANETIYWLNLMKDTGYDDGNIQNMESDCRELLALLVATVKKLKSK